MIQAAANIVLIGYRAVGKTTIGALLAAQLRRPFIDLDAEVEAEAGETIASLVQRAGWPEFRRREKEAVQRYAARRGQVLATGGGVVLDPDNIARLRSTGHLIWLKASPATIRARLRQETVQVASRPGLTAQGTLAEIDEVLAAREPFYAAAATLTLDVDLATPEELVQEILHWNHVWEQTGT
ncbi:MAG: shikimate kinase [Desulfobacca sp.]|uniref:shikimate kinase n=1 Tax=Desulfobacca sp. TaxID=2067990 RepID=UPI00404B5B59